MAAIQLPGTVLHAQSQSRFRQRLQPFISSPVFDFWASRINPALSWDRPLARIVGRRNESADAVTLDLAPNRNFRDYAPGQHLNVTVEVDGVHLTRSYSPSDIPSADRRVSITVRRVDGGKLSNYLHDRAQIGDVVELGAAFGEMTWPAQPSGPWLFLAAGSGITPLMSLTRSFAANPAADASLTLLYWARNSADHCFVDELRALAARDARFDVQFILTGDRAPSGDEAHGRPSEALIARLVPDLADRGVYACGPAGFVDSVRALAGVTASTFKAEAFTPAPIVSAATGTVRVTLARSGRTLELPVDRALLPALEAQGIEPAHGCRMGLCNTCACTKFSGTTQNLLSGASESEATPALRICVSRAQSDLTLDL